MNVFIQSAPTRSTPSPESPDPGPAGVDSEGLRHLVLEMVRPQLEAAEQRTSQLRQEQRTELAQFREEMTRMRTEIRQLNRKLDDLVKRIDS